jgi:hypothetical protein
VGDNGTSPQWHASSSTSLLLQPDCREDKGLDAQATVHRFYFLCACSNRCL